MRRLSLLLQISRLTVARKLEFLGQESLTSLKDEYLNLPESISEMQFDDMETFEHTKLKPISITLAVEKKTRRILGFKLSRMNAKGHLAKLSRKKYGLRRDERRSSRKRLFLDLKPKILESALIESDENPHYLPDINQHFPKARYRQFKGQRGSVVGQGELKKIRFDPLFSINHSCAMLRANINRLFRRTWCTTKKIDKLEKHIAIYAQFHNRCLI